MYIPIIYYSTNTTLAYRISERFYQGKHFVYLSPFFAENSDPLFPNPPSSSPSILFERFSEEAKSNDHNAKLIQGNKTGLRKGVEERWKSKIITAEVREILVGIINESANSDFEPLLYIIPAEKVKDEIKTLKYDQKGHPFCEEYYIENLTRDKFDVIKIK